MPFKKLSEHLYLVGSPNLSHSLDCNVYLIDGRPRECVLVDSGCGLGVANILRNTEEIGVNLGLVSAVVNTHCHFRHAGGNFRLNQMLGYCEVIIHELDTKAVETGDSVLTGADFYGQRFEPCEVNVQAYTDNTKIMKAAGFGTQLMISAGETEFTVTHTPGHTPGSMVIHGELDGSKVLFAGDIDRLGKRGFDIMDWRKSVNKLLELDADKIYAGHEIMKTEPRRWLESLRKKGAEASL
jgi:glyoxylase-like metal-dependent hydrolase (beta-lactamase superfamily II)